MFRYEPSQIPVHHLLFMGDDQNVKTLAALSLPNVYFINARKADIPQNRGGYYESRVSHAGFIINLITQIEEKTVSGFRPTIVIDQLEDIVFSEDTPIEELTISLSEFVERLNTSHANIIAIANPEASSEIAKLVNEQFPRTLLLATVNGTTTFDAGEPAPDGRAFIFKAELFTEQNPTVRTIAVAPNVPRDGMVTTSSAKTADNEQKQQHPEQTTTPAAVEQKPAASEIIKLEDDETSNTKGNLASLVLILNPLIGTDYRTVRDYLYGEKFWPLTESGERPERPPIASPADITRYCQLTRARIRQEKTKLADASHAKQ